ncbi:MAG: ATP-binding protein, partial [Candidatus Zixiibacteriota bacterium]
FLVAFISGYLVERLIRKDKELEDKSKALKQAQLETDDILRHLNSGLLTVDKDCKIIFFNKGAEEILGYRESEVKGLDFRDIFNERLSELSDNLLSVLYTQKEKPRIELDICNSDNRIIPIGVSTSLLLDDDHYIRGVIAIFQDLTDTKKLEEKIRMADRLAAVGELSAAIAHEIRNPLAAISGSVEVLSDSLKVDGEDKRLLDLIIKESNRLNNILSDFLLYARIRRTTPVKVELCRLASNVIEMVRHCPAYHSGINLHMSSLESFVYVFSDEDHLKQILINLIINACEALDKEGGDVKVKIDRNSDNDVYLSIMDNGMGITEETLNQVYAPFYSTKRDGTGLGLAIVQRLSKSLNIGLSCHSQPGKGTTFCLVFNQLSEKYIQDIDQKNSVAVR